VANADGCGTAKLTALAGIRVAGEHLLPATVERFAVFEGELTWPHRVGSVRALTAAAFR
jgi:hypothetical protein